MTVIREQSSSTSAGSGLALGVDMYFDFLHRQIAVARMFVVAGARLSTAIFSERGVELIGCGNRIEIGRTEQVTELPVELAATEPSTGSLTLHRPAELRPAVDRVFDEIVGYMIAADITGDRSTPVRGMLVP